MAINSGQYSGNAAEERRSPAVDGGQKDGKKSESKRFKELLFCMVRDCRLSMMAAAVVVTLTVYFVLAVTGLFYFYGFIKLLILGWLLYSLPVAKMQRFQQFLLDLLKRMKQFLDFSLKIKNLELEKKAGNDDKPMIVSFGEMLIDFVPDVAGVPLAKATGFLKAPGGAPANVACAVAKLGGKSAFIGKVGEDEFGKMLAEILKEHNVNLDGLRFDKVARTALAFVTLKTNGEGDFMFYRNLNADMMLEESELNMGLIKRARVFHYGSISLISEPCRSAHIAAMETAKRTGGVLLSYDPNVRLPLWDSPDTARNEIKSIWEYADIIKVSGEEVEFLTGGDPEDDLVVLKLWHENLKLLVVTYGEKGCRYYTKNFLGRIPGFSVKTVDATGAGDAFVGSLLVSIVEEDDSIFSNWEKLKKALTLANACGAICTTKKGAIPALPTMADAQNLVNKVTAEQGI